MIKIISGAPTQKFAQSVLPGDVTIDGVVLRVTDHRTDPLDDRTISIEHRNVVYELAPTETVQVYAKLTHDLARQTIAAAKLEEKTR